MKTCHRCSFRNEPVASHCTGCGELLLDVSDPPTERQQLAWKLRSHVAWQDIRLPPHAALVLYLSPSSEPLLLPGKEQILIGRAGASGLRRPDVDLTDFEAEQYGVSRLHAAIDLQDGAVFLTDLGSTNGTYLNALRLPSGKPRIVCSGDQICFGNLIAYLYFRNLKEQDQ